MNVPGDLVVDADGNVVSSVRKVALTEHPAPKEIGRVMKMRRGFRIPLDIRLGGKPKHESKAQRRMRRARGR